MRATGTRFLIVGFLAMLMYILLFLVSAMSNNRADFSSDTIREATAYALTLGFHGAAELQDTPMGRTSISTMTSDWLARAFTALFWPDGSDITDPGNPSRRERIS